MENEYGQHLCCIAPEDLNLLREEAAKAEEYLNLAKRVQADFLNYQDRMKRERENAVKYGAESFIAEFLPILDDFRMFLQSMAGKIDEKQIEGLRLAERNILLVLEKCGVKPIDCKSAPFDPRLHNAVMVEETENVPEGTVTGVLRQGYTIHDRVLRPAQVKVSKGKKTSP